MLGFLYSKRVEGTPPKDVSAVEEQPSDSIKNNVTDIPEIPKIKLSEKIYGEWINTSLFDSTLAQKS